MKNKYFINFLALCSALLISAIAHSQDFYASGANVNECRTIDQSGDIDIWHCRNSVEGKIRCYADVDFGDGVARRIWGQGCYSNFSYCLWTGSGRVDICN